MSGVLVDATMLFGASVTIFAKSVAPVATVYAAYPGSKVGTHTGQLTFAVFTAMSVAWLLRVTCAASALACAVFAAVTAPSAAV